MTIIWPGEPGERYTNNTSRIVYQLICSCINTCGVCYQCHLAIAEWWGKFHHGCNCISLPIFPGEQSQPYQDFREIIKDLPPEQQIKVMGKAVYELYQEGVITWEDAITPTRIRTLREIVSREQLTVEELVEAGVSEHKALDAWLTVNSPSHQLAAAARESLVQQLIDLHMTPEHITEIFGVVMSKTVTINEQNEEHEEPDMTDEEWVELIEQYINE